MKPRSKRWMLTARPDAREFIVYARTAEEARAMTGCFDGYACVPAGAWDRETNTILDNPDAVTIGGTDAPVIRYAEDGGVLH